MFYWVVSWDIDIGNNSSSCSTLSQELMKRMYGTISTTMIELFVL